MIPNFDKNSNQRLIPNFCIHRRKQKTCTPRLHYPDYILSQEHWYSYIKNITFQQNHHQQARARLLACLSSAPNRPRIRTLTCRLHNKMWREHLTKARKDHFTSFPLSSDDETDTVISGSHNRQNPRFC